MQTLSLHHPSQDGMTGISNRFIDDYMPSATGESVKLYLCLLRRCAGQETLSLDAVADALHYTENDILRGLQYWEKQGLLRLEYDAQGALSGLTFSDPRPQSTPAPEALLQQEAAPLPEKTALTAERLDALRKQDDVRQLLFIAESYLGKTLSSSEITSLLYYYDSLHFGMDLIEYLIEYCISRGSTSFHYIDKVALGWARNGIKTVSDAKAENSLYSRKYYNVLHAFGISGRAPVKSEIAAIDRWYDELHFTEDLILEACSRTVAQTQHPTFSYADKILESWHQQGIRHLSEIAKLDEKHRTETKNRQNKAPRASANNRFNNFSQRDYDFEHLESLLNR